MNARAVALGLRAQKGGALVVAATAEHVVLSTSFATAVEGDALAREPYRLAFDMARGPDGRASDEARAAVAEGRRRQDAAAAAGLQRVVARIEAEGYRPDVAALLVNRAGWITDLLDYSLGWADHVPVAEGLAVREALRFAVARAGLTLVELDEKSLLETLASDARLPAQAAHAGKPWRKEQKLACLAAWTALAGRG